MPDSRLGTGWYDDELVRTTAGWRVGKRVCRLHGWSGNPSVPEPNREHHPDMNPNALHLFAEDGKIAYLEAVKAG
jgi:hypothetical protein